MTNETQKTAVEWYSRRLFEIEIAHNQGVINSDVYLKSKTHALEKAKEIEKEQSQVYAEFCVKCDRNKLILLEFDSWVKLQPSRKEYYNTILRRRR
jgi:hypothetical protein